MPANKRFRVTYVRSIRQVGYIDVDAANKDEASLKAEEAIEDGDDALTMMPEEHLVNMEQEEIRDLDEDVVEEEQG